MNKQLFRTSDSTNVEIRSDFAPESTAALIVWPCMGGNTAMYRLPVRKFTAAGISVIQFNPRGHGASGGQYDLEASSRDLHEYLESVYPENFPLWLMGHSAGANAVLKFGTARNRGERFILVSPVLDSKQSLRYMYSNGSIMEFIQIISEMTSDKEFAYSVLNESSWMDRDVWEMQNYRVRFNRISCRILAGDILEKLFIEGYNAFEDLSFHKNRTSILLPGRDNWFPVAETAKLAALNSIPIETLYEAKDHYFTGAWKIVSDRILSKILK